MRLSVVAFGKLKTPGLRESADYYTKLLRPWVQVDEAELKPLPVPEKSVSIRRQIQEKEAELLTKRIGPKPGARSCYYLLDEAGKALKTREWAALAKQWEDEGLTEVSVCVGSSLGFSDAVRAGARGILSLGPQTLAHELARVVLLEQLYRAWSVLRGHPYHNEGS